MTYLLTVLLIFLYLNGVLLIYSVLDLFFSNTYRWVQITTSFLWFVLGIIVFVMILKRKVGKK